MAKIQRLDENETLKEKINSDLEPRTLLATEVLARFRSATAHKTSYKVGDYMLTQLLRECYEARDDATLCSEYENLQKYPQWTQMPISLVSFKVNILVSLIRENLIDVATAPFIIDPTPNPEIPEEVRSRILGDVENRLLELAEETTMSQSAFLEGAMTNGLDPITAQGSEDFPVLDGATVENLLKEEKIKAIREVKKHAEEQAALLQRELYDKTIEGGYKKALMEFIDDFATYPFACLHAPVPVIRNITKWNKNKFVEEKKVIWGFERISPFDLYWTEDSTNTQDGSAIFIKKQVSYEFLYDAKRFAKDDEKSGYILSQIEELIEMTEESRIPRNWSAFMLGNPELHTNTLTWNRGDNTEIIICYGRFTGYDLREMDFKGETKPLDDEKMYECKIILCGGQVIFCQLNKNPGENKRPVFTASFEARNNSIVGVGLGQKLLSIHKAYKAVINLAMYNLGLASEPITEVEATRIIKYMPDDWIDEPTISPGLVIPADGDRQGNGSRAIKFTQIPTTINEALQLANFIFEQAHIISNIPAALHGQPVGTGANRTVRGLLTLQGNTLKPIQSALINLDINVIEPMITLLYMMLVMYDDDFEYTGDCKVVAKGAASMVQREMEKQAAMENIQILGQLGQVVNPELLNRTIEKLLQTAGILEPGESAINQMPQEPMNVQQPSQVAPPQGLDQPFGTPEPSVENQAPVN